MLRTTRTLLLALPALRRVLRRAYGWRWPLALLRCGLASRRLVRRSRWAVRQDVEARLAALLALLPAIVLDARRHEREDGVPRALLDALLEPHLRRIVAELAAIGGARERWHAFADRVVQQGIGAFNETEFVSVDDDRFELRVHRCLFAELARDAGVPKLGQELCRLGATLCAQVLPSHEFHRNGPAECTLAYGQDHCDYVWERRERDAVPAEERDFAGPAGRAQSSSAEPAEDPPA
jgi:predicted ArsR family transcriptional regulator